MMYVKKEPRRRNEQEAEDFLQDAFAILFAAHHPALRLLGISTGHGNASLERTTRNALSILEAIGRSDIPVVSGSRKPFCRQPHHAPEIHGTRDCYSYLILPAETCQAKVALMAPIFYRNLAGVR
jgi:uridine nucleosidase